MAATRTFEIERESSPAPAPVATSAPGRGRRYAMVALLLVPAAVIIWCGWRHRWTADDGFINLRVVRQVLDGNGPVFNAGRHVETGTSPAWIAELSFLDVVTPLRLEWIAAITALLSTAARWCRGVRHASGADRDRAPRDVPPAGCAGVRLPAAGVGLRHVRVETGMSLLWLAGSWWFLCGRIGDRGHSGKVPSLRSGAGARRRSCGPISWCSASSSSSRSSPCPGAGAGCASWRGRPRCRSSPSSPAWRTSAASSRTPRSPRRRRCRTGRKVGLLHRLRGEHALVIPIVALGVIAWAQLRAITCRRSETSCSSRR